MVRRVLKRYQGAPAGRGDGLLPGLVHLRKPARHAAAKFITQHRTARPHYETNNAELPVWPRCVVIFEAKTN